MRWRLHKHWFDGAKNYTWKNVEVAELVAHVNSERYFEIDDGGVTPAGIPLYAFATKKTGTPRSIE
jgi:hypothetical protein